MNREQVALWLEGLTDKQFVEFFYEHLSSRHLYNMEREYMDSHLVLANAVRSLEDPDLDDQDHWGPDPDRWGPWRLQLLCPVPQNWVDHAPVCEFGKHGGFETASWAKRSTCPICGKEVYGT